VTEEPEQVLEEQRVATGNEELGANGVVKQKEGHANDERW